MSEQWELYKQGRINGMKNQAEIYQALLDGKTLAHKRSDKKINLKEGTHMYTFSDYYNWSIYEAPKEKVKLYLFAMGSGSLTTSFYTEDTMKCWDGNSLITYPGNDYWIRTNTFIEVEI